MKFGKLAAFALAAVVGGASHGEAVKASGFGFNADNATACLQKAIDSGASEVLVDNVGKDWILDPVKLRSDLTLIIGDGVTLRARHDGFHGATDCLFYAKELKNVVVKGGRDSRIVNHNAYCDRSKYSYSEGRHNFFLAGCDNVEIRDLTLDGSGGDGVYIRNTVAGPCRNIRLENLFVQRQGRQGVSVISAENLSIRNCTFRDTKGMSPSAGIDFEPNRPTDVFRNCVVGDCRFLNNDGCGIVLALSKLRAGAAPEVSITVERCYFEGNHNNINIQRRAYAPAGSIVFRDCELKDSRGTSISFGFTGKLPVTFENMKVSHSAERPVLTVSMPTVNSEIEGTVAFRNVDFNYDAKKHALLDIFTYPAPVTAKLVLENVTANGKAVPRIPAWDKYVRQMKSVSGKVAKLDLEQLKTPEKGTPRKEKSRVFFRRRTVLLLDGRKGEKIVVNVRQINVRRNRPGSFVYQLTDPEGTQSGGWRKVAEDSHSIEIDPQMDGIYRLDFGSGNKLKISTRHRGQGFTTFDDSFHFIAPAGSVFFEVPAGVTEFHLVLFGDPNEPVSASLISPSGEVVQEVVDSDKAQQLRGVAGGKQPEIWELRFGRCKEDVTLQLLAPLVPIISEHPELMFRKKETKK